MYCVNVKMSQSLFMIKSEQQKTRLFQQELNITPKIAEYEKILNMDSILGG